MPELTPQDRESYVKLCNAAEGLLNVILGNAPDLKIGDSFTLRELTQAFSRNLLQANLLEPNLLEPKDLSNFEELQSRVELTGGYLTMYQLFADAIATSNAKDNINQASQKLQIQYNQLKVSLAAIDDDFLDDLIPPCSDPLFLGLLTDVGTSKVKSWTQQLLSDRTPVLTDSQVQELINAWGRAVTTFVKDTADNADKVKPGEPKTIAHFFCIHDQLEGLYSELSTAVALNS
jgi:hypothetical protein